MGTFLVLLLVGAILIGAIAVNAFLLPPGHVFASLLIIPIVVAALRLPPPVVLGIAGLSLGVFLVQAEAQDAPEVILPMGGSAIVLAAVVGHVAARQRQMLTRHAAEQLALRKVARALVEETGLQPVADVIVAHTQQLMHATRVGLWLVDEGRQELRLMADRGYPPEHRELLRTLPFSSTTTTATAARTRRPIEVTDLRRIPTTLPDAYVLFQLGKQRSAYAQPLVAWHRLVGVLTILKPVPHRFSERERELMQALGTLSAIAIENASLFEQTQGREAEAQDSRRQLQMFLGMVAHDLAGPLTVVVGYVQLLRRGLGGKLNDSERRSFDAVESGLRRIRRLVDDLRDATHIREGHFTITPGPIELVGLLRQILEEQQAATTTHRLSLAAPDRLTGEWDPDRIGQLVTNLVSNAIKYSPAGGEVRVQAEPAGERVVITVADQGPGIPPDRVGELFRPFVRIKGNTNHQVNGLGLGLYICKGIAEAHGGSIRVESAVGRGTAVIVELPLHPPPTNSPTEAPE